MTEQTRTYFQQMYETAKRYHQTKAEREKEKEALMNADDWDAVSAWHEREKQFQDPFTPGQYKAYWAFRRSSEMQSDELEMSDSLWEREVKDFSETLRAAGVTSFVLTNQSTGLMEDIHNLEAQCWQLAGTCKLQVSESRCSSECVEERLGLRFVIEKGASGMKFNEETSMDPLLEEAVRENLENLNLYARTWQTKRLFLAGLNGIATALHALTGEIWSCELSSSGYVFINEAETECISAEA